VFVEVRSIGAINKDVNAALSKQICELFAKEGVDPEYIDVNFMDVPPQNWGKSTGTF
jgi:phenylpyruvate tautomerase PptA (4-oxalocrotonate tautomerase family)